MVRASLAGGAGLALGGSLAAAPAQPEWATAPAADDAEEALSLLAEGNRRWSEGWPRHPHTDSEHRRQTAEEQHPFATVLGCADSRVPPERVFDRGVGDLFTVRTAGQMLDSAGLASLAYGARHLRTPLLLVLGHAGCGAVAAAVEAHRNGAVPAGHLGPMVEALLPVVEELAEDGDTDEDLMDAAVSAHARDLAARLRTDSEIGGEPAGPRIAAARYELDTGEVRFLD